MVLEYVLGYIGVIVTILLALFGPKVKEFLDTIIAEEHQKLVFDLANRVVLALQEELKDKSGQEKYDEAVKRIKDALEEEGVPASDGIINTAIHAAVSLIRGEPTE